MDNKNEKINISRDLYKKIKGFNKEQMNSFLTDIYKTAADEAAKDIETASVDLSELREEIGKIKGIGENRLNEIMAVIEKKLNE